VAQAEKFRDKTIKRYRNLKGMSLLSSPKIRCVETLQPLARKLELPIQIDPLLAEQFNESTEAFQARVLMFWNAWLKTQHPITVISTHGDWIPLFFKIIFGEVLSLKKGDSMRLSFKLRS